MKVLIACEHSQVVAEAFIKQGFDAVSCDLLPGEKGLPHYQGDVLDILFSGFDLLIAHPPCTFLCNSGVRWLYSEPERWKELITGASFFRKLLHAPIPYVAVENPLPHKYAVQIIETRYTQLIQPWQYGHGETKATCLWLKNLPKLKPVAIVSGREAKVHKAAPGPDRWKIRSKTYEGIAQAMAAQWGNYILNSKLKAA